MKILIVDDNLFNINALKAVLNSQAYSSFNIFSAQSGEEAIEFLAT